MTHSGKLLFGALVKRSLVGRMDRGVGLVDQVTQQNASASEQLVATADELHQQAESLERLLSFLKVKASAA